MKIYKYFLLHNKKLKPWIKYWLYIKSKDKNYALSDILDGTSFYLENSSNKNFNLFQINGNSIQDGTPTPTNPVEIKSAGDNGYITEGISNKNLFNMDGKPSEDRLSSAGYTLKYNDDKTITINGTGTGAYKFLTWDLTLEAGTYIASGCPSGGSQNGYSFLINVGSSSYWDYGNGVSFTLIAKTTIQVHPIRIGSTIPTFNNVTFKPMIRLSSTTDASFVSHQEQNISIPCQQPMRSIGNVRDGFVKIDGVWYEKHVIGQVVLNGIRDWVKSTTYSNEKYFCGYLAYGISNSIEGSFTINDRFQIGHYSYVLDKECMSSMPQLHVRILASRLTENSVNAFKTWLSTHNTEVIYQLAEPIYLECTQEQIEALESITQAYTYKQGTNINSTDETPAYLNIQYFMEV